MIRAWYQSSPGFFQYLVDHGLPERTPVAAVATGEAARNTAPAAQSVPWAGVRRRSRGGARPVAGYPSGAPPGARGRPVDPLSVVTEKPARRRPNSSSPQTPSKRQARLDCVLASARRFGRRLRLRTEDRPRGVVRGVSSLSLTPVRMNSLDSGLTQEWIDRSELL